MNQKLVLFILWFVMMAVYIYYCKIDGEYRRQFYDQTIGNVVGQQRVPFTVLRNVLLTSRPIIEYPAAGKKYRYVDEKVKLANGEKPVIYFEKKDHSRALVYNYRFWIDEILYIPIVLCHVLCVFAFIIFRMTEPTYEERERRYLALLEKHGIKT